MYGRMREVERWFLVPSERNASAAGRQGLQREYDEMEVENAEQTVDQPAQQPVEQPQQAAAGVGGGTLAAFAAGAPVQHPPQAPKRPAWNVNTNFTGQPLGQQPGMHRFQAGAGTKHGDRGGRGGRGAPRGGAGYRGTQRGGYRGGYGQNQRGSFGSFGTEGGKQLNSSLDARYTPRDGPRGGPRGGNSALDQFGRQ
ncbi:hypothetical protein LTR17_010236 [Elasticomyces elasticus]|nr:hypothetical protein LTR17_010236 [Elasticomyces elasticus]